MSWVATAVVGAAVIGGVTTAAVASSNANDARDQAQRIFDQQQAAQGSAASSAENATMAAAEMSAEAIKYAADKSAETQWKMYNQAREDQMPWLIAGRSALATLQKKIKEGPGEFTADPGYQFRLGQGNDNILSNASATGNLASGRTLKALTEYGQDYASNEYDKFINRYYQSLTPYQSLAGVGMSTATNLGQQGISAGNSIGNAYSSAGNSLANIYSQQGSNLSQIYTNQGNAMANAYANYGNAMTQANIYGNTGTANAITGAINTGITGLAQYYGAQAAVPANATSTTLPLSQYGMLA